MMHGPINIRFTVQEVALQSGMSFERLVLPEDGYRLQPKHVAVVYSIFG